MCPNWLGQQVYPNHWGSQMQPNYWGSQAHHNDPGSRMHPNSKGSRAWPGQGRRCAWALPLRFCYTLAAQALQDLKLARKLKCNMYSILHCNMHITRAMCNFFNEVSPDLKEGLYLPWVGYLCFFQQAFLATSLLDSNPGEKLPNRNLLLS
jgi:hypothetical protein